MVCTYVLIYFGRPRLSQTVKTKTTDPRICPNLIFKNGPGVASPANSTYDLTRKIFLMLYSIN